jgi:hypothetical protein
MNSINLTHYKLNENPNELDEALKLEDYSYDSKTNQPFHDFLIDIEEMELNQKTIQVFKTEKDFMKYKALFQSENDFVNDDYYRIIEDKSDDLEKLISSYIETNNLNTFERIEYNRGINGISVRMITFGKRVLKKGVFCEIVTQQKIDFEKIDDQLIHCNYLYTAIQPIELVFSLIDEKSKVSFKKMYLDNFEQGKSIFVFQQS